MTLELPDQVLSTLREGRQAHIAVPSRHGPHVTPELYTWSQGKLWFAVATTTLKAKVLDRHGHGGALVTASGRTIVLAGEVETYDPRDVKGVIRRLGRLPEVARASGSFVARNASDLLAFVGDTARGRLGRKPPPLRVVFALTPTRALCVENEVVAGAWGEWSVPSSQDDDAVPGGGEAAVLGLPGPVPVPARWFEADSECFVAPGVLDVLQLDRSFPVGLVTDEYRQPGPAAKQGSLLRGQGALTDRRGVVSIAIERVVEWDGVETTSRDPDGDVSSA